MKQIFENMIDVLKNQLWFAGVRYNFNKFSYSQIDSRGSPYDLGSVMHYNGYAFSNNGRPTIVDLRGNAVRTQV